MTTILVVDDSAMDRRVAGRPLEKQPDCQLFYTEDGYAALKSVDENLPDVVVTDMAMPHLDGLQLVKAMKRNFSLIPVIIMTAVGTEKTAVQALTRGAASYVT